MALPDDSASSITVTADYLSPYDRYCDALTDFEAGGSAIGVSDDGLDYQIWELTWIADERRSDYGDFVIRGETTGEVVTPINVADVKSCCLAFNQNMDVFIGYELDDCSAKYYWYDTSIADYTTSTLPAGSRYLQCCLDDHRLTQTGTSDIILAYMRGGVLYYRQQRDRYGTEYTLASGLSGYLNKVGMTKNLRLKFDVQGGANTRLSHIVGDITEMVDYPAAKLDVAELDSTTVRGFLTANTYTAADAIRSLQRVYFFDMPELDGRIKAILRGGNSVATITQNDVVIGREVDFETAREQGVEFPRKLHLSYASVESDYTPTKQTSERRSPDARVTSEVSIEGPVNFEADDAAQRADILHKVAWNELEGTIKFGLDESWNYLVPSNIVSVEVRSGTYKRARITKVTLLDGVLDFEAVIDRQSAYSSVNTAAAIQSPTAPPATIPGDTTWEYMDLPALLTTHDTLHFYVAVRGDADTAWRGATIQRDVGGTFYSETTIQTASTLGALEENLAYHTAYIPDVTNTILVSSNNVPVSITDALLLSGGNACLIGDEIIQFRDVTAEGDNYRLSYLLRGRLDTAAVAHTASERFVLLDYPKRVPVDAAYLDTTLTLRAVSVGATTATDAGYSFTGKSQTEWAPINLAATTTSPVGDWTLSWEPRYRLGNSASPVRSQYFYGWRIRFTVGATTVAKDIDSITPSYTYTSADQVTDFGSVQASFDTVEVRALNSLGGEGNALSEAVP